MKTRLILFSLVLLLPALFSSCKKENDMYAFGGNIYTISVDIQAIKDVPADNPGEIAIVVTTDAPYWMVQSPDWVKANKITCPGREKGSVLAVAVESNYKSMATTTTPRSGVIRIIGGRTSVSIPINQLGHEGWVDPESLKGGISTMEDFMDFVTAVNDGEDPVKWKNDNGEVELKTDLDLSGMDEWVPIGNVVSSGNANNGTNPKGEPFRSVFNGGGHTIRNFKFDVTCAGGTTWGFFGYLDNAVVKNLNFENVDLSLAATGLVDAGVVAGSMRASTIENVKVNGRITSSGSSSNERLAIGGIAGFVFSVTAELIQDSFIRNCETNILAEIDCGSNDANGAGGVMYGGIAGFSTGVKEKPSRNHIVGCVNKGSMTMNVGRSCGICASANYGTVVQGCTNQAAHVSNFVNGRIGQICCLLGIDSAIIDCVNEGDLTTTHSQTTAGVMAALVNDDSAYLEGGTRTANTGTIITANTSTRGLIAAQFSKVDHVSNFILSGKLGNYKASGAHTMIDVTNINVMQYVGRIGAGYESKFSQISFKMVPPTDPWTSGDIDDLHQVDDHWN